MPSSQPSRRQFLASAAPAVLLAQSGSRSSSEKPDKPEPPPSGPVEESQALPQTKVVLPTDSLVRTGGLRRIAAIAGNYWRYSHADDIITRFMEGYSIV